MFRVAEAKRQHLSKVAFGTRQKAPERISPKLDYKHGTSLAFAL
jgi:hypothetical protein